MEILYEDKQLLVAYKEAGLPTQTANLTRRDLVNEVKNHIFKETGEKNPFLGLINRLDQPVEGLVLFGKTKESTAALNKSLQNDSIKKYYYALVYGKRNTSQEELQHFLKKDARQGITRVADSKDRDAKKATLFYEIAGETKDCQLLRILLKSGRHHQIRVQLSHTGTPLIGDLKYGSKESVDYSKENQVSFPALCAYRLELPHPVSGEVLTFSIKPKHPLLTLLNEDYDK